MLVMVMVMVMVTAQIPGEESSPRMKLWIFLAGCTMLTRHTWSIVMMKIIIIVVMMMITIIVMMMMMKMTISIIGIMIN